MLNLIFNEDCLEGMKRIPDNSVDFVLTDLPYGITNCDFDVKIDLQKFWEQINRVTKFNAAVALFAKGKFLIELASSNFKFYRYKWVWQKNLATGFLNSKKMPLCAHEDILLFYKKLPTYNPQFTKGKPYVKKCFRESKNYTNGKREWNEKFCDDGRRFPIDCQSFDCLNAINATQHPQQKPVDLLEYMIKTYTNEGETVLDATIGSGSTAVAAVNCGRNFIGFELDEHFFEVACERVQKAQDEKFQQLVEA